MNFLLVCLLVLFVLWVLAHMKTSRPDGVLIKKLHPYRRLLCFVQENADSSVVYFDEYVKADKLVKFLEEIPKDSKVDVTHCAVVACGLSLLKNPQMNRFAKGFRLYQRKGAFVSFSIKRKKLNKKAKVSAVKVEIKPEMNFEELKKKINGDIRVERSDKKTSYDKEANFFFRLPRPLMSLALKTAYFLDYYNLLPGAMIRGDAMYTSAFMANLGSLGMKSGYHHLFEWGTCPHFITIGEVFDRPVVKEGKVVVEKSLNIRFSYDDRIEDGFNAYHGIKTLIKALENPEEYLSGLKDGVDSKKTFGEIVEVI